MSPLLGGKPRLNRRFPSIALATGALLLGSISPVPAQAAASAGAPGDAVAHVVTAATARQGIVVTLKKTPATLSATFTTDPNGKVRLLLTSNAKKVKVKYVTAKGKKKTLTVTIKKGTKTVLLPAGATKIKAQAKATTKLSASPWVIATVPAPVVPAPIVPAPVVPPDVTPPGPVVALVVGQVTASSIALSWTNPADSDLAEVIVRRSEGSVPPSTPTAGTGVALTSATATSVVNTGLAGNTTYSYAPVHPRCHRQHQPNSGDRHGRHHVARPTRRVRPRSRSDQDLRLGGRIA